MNIPNELSPELRAAYDRHSSRRATEDDLLIMALFEAHGALHSLPPHCLPTAGGMPHNEDHANCCAHRCLSFLRELHDRRPLARAALDKAIRTACAASNDAERALREAGFL